MPNFITVFMGNLNNSGQSGMKNDFFPNIVNTLLKFNAVVIKNDVISSILHFARYQSWSSLLFDLKGSDSTHDKN